MLLFALFSMTVLGLSLYPFAQMKLCPVIIIAGFQSGSARNGNVDRDGLGAYLIGSRAGYFLGNECDRVDGPLAEQFGKGGLSGELPAVSLRTGRQLGDIHANEVASAQCKFANPTGKLLVAKDLNDGPRLKRFFAHDNHFRPSPARRQGPLVLVLAIALESAKL